MLSPSRPAQTRTIDSVNSGLIGGAIEDVRLALARPRVIMLLATRAIQNQFHGMALGLLWITLTTAAWIAGIGLLWGDIFQVEGADHIIYVTMGIPVWGVINTFLQTGSGVFTQHAATFKQTPTPYSLFAFKIALMNVITSSFRLAAPAIALTAFALTGRLTGVSAGDIVLSLIGLALIFAAGFGASLVLGVLAARFADIRELISATMMFAFFVTPIFWEAERLANSPLKMFVDFNPFHHFIEVVRGPLLGDPALGLHFLVAASCALAANLLGFVFFALFRKRLPYWC
jgi:ABC-type polysaccharide/polyol phosphate export permease